MSANREWLDNWLKSQPKAAPNPDTPAARGSSEKAAPTTDGIILANLSPVGQRRLQAILQQTPILPTLRFVAFRAEAFREKDLLDSFEAMLKRPDQRTEARYVPNRPVPGDAETE